MNAKAFRSQVMTFAGRRATLVVGVGPHPPSGGRLPRPTEANSPGVDPEVNQTDPLPNASVRITHRQPLPSGVLTQEQRLAWTKELLCGEPDTLAYRVAGILLLLYAQPLTSYAVLSL